MYKYTCTVCKQQKLDHKKYDFSSCWKCKVPMLIERVEVNYYYARRQTKKKK